MKNIKKIELIKKELSRTKVEMLVRVTDDVIRLLRRIIRIILDDNSKGFIQ